ncbi:hypothetical protein DICSQDRAFT_130344 [Dichomitus squalens LYAD-421 SS1]|uniref:Uncharacterized protein n=1 Tax=Dichomitus squalens (strain LYAD-421) TaxID=732165 RepID=R7SLR6_DICSQ|nr:uncharacterized protein DICSQDRAFT_130344 [Dichomitus squalens LYAD-421 SS1]EJF55987.1 hypothetical protein DICSQDRAFT_130344 [Dichomitus squalens LYAD-421 SS1]
MSGAPASSDPVSRRFAVHSVESKLALVAIETVLLGVLTWFFLRCLVALFIWQKHLGSWLSQTAGKMLIIPYGVTWLYVITNLLGVRAYILEAISAGPGSLLSPPASTEPDDADGSLQRFFFLSQCVGSVTLTLNVKLFGLVSPSSFSNLGGSQITDTPVQWRDLLEGLYALGLGKAENHVLGIIDFVWACQPRNNFDTITIGSANLYRGYPAARVAVFAPLIFNVAVTLLFAYRAWQARDLVIKYISQGHGFAKTEKVLFLIVESNALWCIFSGIIALWEGKINSPSLAQNSSLDSFWAFFSVIVDGALVPLLVLTASIQAIHITFLILLGISGKSTFFSKGIVPVPASRLPKAPKT